MKNMGVVGPGSGSSVLTESAILARPAAAILVEQALAALGDPETVAELAQRLTTTLAMLWSDVARADLFVPHGGSGELRGLRDPLGGHALLSAVGAPVDGEPGVQVIPLPPTLVAGDHAVGCGSTMSVALATAGVERAEGFIVVQRRATAPDFLPTDLDALAELARGVGQLLPRARAGAVAVAASGAAAAAFAQDDLASARDMQRMFLPRPLATNSANARVLAEYLPAFAVGGDFYDFIDLGDGRLLAAIGDVSGKGVTAALMMSRISSELHRLAAESKGPAEILARLNDSLPGRMQDDRFVTVVCVLLDVPNRRWVVANA